MDILYIHLGMRSNHIKKNTGHYTFSVIHELILILANFPSLSNGVSLEINALHTQYMPNKSNTLDSKLITAVVAVS